MIRPGKAKGPWVGPATSGGGGVASAAGPGIQPSGTTELASSLAVFRDDFRPVTAIGVGALSYRPFWDQGDVLSGGMWEIDTVANVLRCIADSTQYSVYRSGVEGDFDHSIFISKTAGGSHGFYGVSFGSYIISRLTYFMDNVEFVITGSITVSVQVPVGALSSLWLRFVRVGNVLSGYYKLTEADNWTLVHSESNPALSAGGVDFSLGLDTAATVEISRVIFYDNSFSRRVRSDAPLIQRLTPGSGALRSDARHYDVALASISSNTLIYGPDHPSPFQKIILVLNVSSGAVTFSTGTAGSFRFGTDLPAPTVPTGKTSYFGFIYNSNDLRWDYVAETKGF